MLCNKLDFYFIFLEGFSLLVGEFPLEDAYLLYFIYFGGYFSDLLFYSVFSFILYSLYGLLYLRFKDFFIFWIWMASGEFLAFLPDLLFGLFLSASSYFLNAECLVFRMIDYLLAYLSSLFQVLRLILNDLILW